MTQQIARQASGRRRKQSRFAEDFSDLMRWWGSTLSTFVPDGLKNAYSTRRQSVYLWQADDGYRAGLPGKPELGSITDNKSLRRRVSASDPVLLFSEAEVLVRQRRMPVASLARLNTAMRLQITAETPFDLNEIYEASRVTGDPDSDGNVLVEQAIVKRDLADARLAELRSLEIDLAGADIVGSDGLPSGFNLLPEDKCARQGAFLPTVNRVLTFAALALTVAVGASWYVHQSRQASQLEVAASQSGKIAREVLALQASAQNGIAAIEQIEAASANPGRFIAAFAAVTDALGDDSWLESFTYAGNTVSMMGVTHSSDELIPALEAIPAVASAQFISPLVTDRRYEAERFRVEIVFRSSAEGTLASMEDRG